MATIKDIQAVELQILKEVVKVCDNNNIKYYLHAGTFLGAVRHQGFIPWDDDIDIMIHFDDIKRFEKACKRELPKDYCVQSFDSAPGMGELLLKCRRTDTYMLEPGRTKSDMYNQGIWIDVFPLLKIGDTEKEFRDQVESLHKLQTLTFARVSPLKLKCSLKTWIIRSIQEIFYLRPITRKLYKQAGKLQGNGSNGFLPIGPMFYGEINEALIRRYIMKREWIESVSKYKFEDSEFYAFSDYDACLSQVFGPDYMVPKKYAHLDNYDDVII